jgi:signal transduction histidine kinase
VEPDQSVSDAQTRRLGAVMNRLPCGVVELDESGAVLSASTLAARMLDMPLAPGSDFGSLLGERFNLPEVILREDFERGFDVRTDAVTLWLQAGPPEADEAGRVVVVTDVTQFSREVDERAMSLRFLLHDLRSPLSSISALTQLEASDADAFEHCGGMQQIRQLAHYVLSLGEQYIFSSVAEHLQARDFKRFELRATVRQIISQLDVTAVYCGVPLQLWLNDSTPVWVNGMRNFVARAIQNVIDNAIRVSPRGEAVKVTLRMSEGFAEVLVDDRAGGLPGLRENERLTDFERLSKNSSSGFGLGLKLAVQILELHGGSMFAELNGDGGTVFVLRMPCLNAASARSPDTSLIDFDRAWHGARD